MYCVTLDLTGFFLQTEQDSIILLKLTGVVALLLGQFRSGQMSETSA